MRYEDFSSVPTLRARISLRQKQREDIDTEISKTFIEFLMNNGEFIHRQASSVGGTATIYTVPEDRVIFVFAVALSLLNTATSTGGFGSLTFPDISSGGAISLLLGTTSQQIISETLSFNPMIRLEAGQRVQVITGIANLQVSGNIMGYEIDKRLVATRI